MIYFWMPPPLPMVPSTSPYVTIASCKDGGAVKWNKNAQRVSRHRTLSEVSAADNPLASLAVQESDGW